MDRLKRELSMRGKSVSQTIIAGFMFGVLLVMFWPLISDLALWLEVLGVK